MLINVSINSSDLYGRLGTDREKERERERVEERKRMKEKENKRGGGDRKRVDLCGDGKSPQVI